MSSVRRLHADEVTALRLVRRQPDWTAADDAVLKARYGQHTAADLGAELGRTTAAVWARARSLGLGHPKPNRGWTPDEDRVLFELAGAVPRTALAAKLGRTAHAIDGRLRTLGLNRETTVASRYARDQEQIARLGAENRRLLEEQRGLLEENRHLRSVYHPSPNAAPATTVPVTSADARRLAVLLSYRMGVLSAAEAAVALGIPLSRLPVALGRGAAQGLDVVRESLGEGDA